MLYSTGGSGDEKAQQTDRESIPRLSARLRPLGTNAVEVTYEFSLYSSQAQQKVTVASDEEKKQSDGGQMTDAGNEAGDDLMEVRRATDVIPLRPAVGSRHTQHRHN